MKRIFAAIKINPNEELTKAFYLLKSKLSNEKIKWVELHNLHITLKFFGETDEDLIPKICEHLTICAQSNKIFSFQLKNIGVFGSSYKPRVIWVGIENNNLLKKFGLEVLSEMDKIGFKIDRQNFVPHLTLGRIKFIEDKAIFNKTIGKFSDQLFQQYEVSQFYLIESILKPTGPEYKSLSSFNLA